MRSSHSRLGAVLALVAASACQCGGEQLNEPNCAYVVNPHDQRPDDPSGADVRPLAFGEVRKGDKRTRTITVDNTKSNVQLTGLKLAFSTANAASYGVEGDVPVINPGESATITLAFTPVPIDGDVGNTLTVTHPNFDSKSCPTFTVTLLGRALPPLPPDGGPGVDAGQDAGTDAGPGDGGGHDSGPVQPRADAGAPLSDGGHFETRGGMQEARSQFGAALLPSGEILLVGGFDQAGQVLGSVEFYNPYTGLSRKGPPLVEARARHVTVVLGDGRVLVHGGVGSGAVNVAQVLSSAEIFDPATSMWTTVSTSEKRAGHLAALSGADVLLAYGDTQTATGAPLSPATGAVLLKTNGMVDAVAAAGTAGAPRAGAAMVDLGDGQVLFLGGQDMGGAALADVVRFSAGALEVLSLQLPNARAFGAAARFKDGPVVLTGGQGGAGALIVADMINVDGAASTWTVSTLMAPTGARVQGTLTRVQDTVLLAAGGHPVLPGDGGVLAQQDAELFIHVGSGVVLAAGTGNGLSVPRVHAGLVAFDGGVAFLGGSATEPRRSARPDVDTYVPATNRFASMGLIGPGGAATGAAVRQLFVAGGVDLSTGRVSARTRLLNLETAAFQEGPAMLSARSEATATLLQDADILIAGGATNTGDVLQVAERHGSALLSKLPTGGMVQARRKHSATLLLDGRVLLCGGLGAGNVPLDTCELFRPNDNSFIAVTGRMVRGRHEHSATLLDDGTVLLVGGNDPALGPFKGDIFDPVDNSLRATMGRPLQARRGHVAVLVGTGRVLLAGGETFNGARVPTDTAELFDAVSEEFDALPELGAAREGPAGIFFLGGQVLVTGGAASGTGDPDFPTRALRTSELYDPSVLPLGDFIGLDRRLTFPRARAVADQTLGTPLILLGEGRHGVVAPGVEARVPLTTVEEWVP